MKDEEIVGFLLAAFFAGVFSYGLIVYHLATPDKSIARGEMIIIDNSSYKCKMINTLKEK